MQSYTLSIITINLNNGDGLRKTLGSLEKQTWKDFESIIIDGGSSDISVQVIQEFENKKMLHIGKWVSEKDSGLYNAQNKGIKAASGKYLLFLNSGDYLYSDKTLEKLKPESWDADIIYGNILVLKGWRKIKTKIPMQITAEILYNNSLWHPASFIKKKIFDVVGYYREDFKICSDYYFFVKAILQHKVQLQYYKDVISIFEADGISSNSKYQTIHQDERLQTQNEFFTPEMRNMIAEMQLLRKRMNSLKFAILALPRFVYRFLRDLSA